MSDKIAKMTFGVENMKVKRTMRRSIEFEREESAGLDYRVARESKYPIPRSSNTKPVDSSVTKPLFYLPPI